MSSDYVNELVKLAAVDTPFEAPSTEDWRKAEMELGGCLPQDYKELVSRLGSGTFGCGLHLRNPRSSSEYLRLSRRDLIFYRTMVALSEERSKITLYPGTEGLVEIAGIDRQHFLLQPDDRGNFKSGIIWWDLDYEQTRHLGVTISQFIYTLYFGMISDRWAVELREYFWQNDSELFSKATPASD